MTRASVKVIGKLLSGSRENRSDGDLVRPNFARTPFIRSNAVSENTPERNSSPYRSPMCGTGLSGSPSVSRLRKNSARSSPLFTSSPRLNVPRVGLAKKNMKLTQQGLTLNSNRFKKLKRLGAGMSRDEYKELISASQETRPFNFSLSVAKSEITTIDLTEEEISISKVKAMVSPQPVDIVKTQIKVIDTQEKLREERHASSKAETVINMIEQSTDQEKEELLRKLEELRIKSRPKRERLKEGQRRNVELIRKKLPSKPKLPELPDGLDEKVIAQVKDIWSRGSAGEVVGQFERNECTRGDLCTLKGLSWLNDEVMNFYYAMISGRAKANSDLPTVHQFSTFFYAKLQKDGYKGVKRWTRKTNIFEFDRVIIPIHLGVHWTCCAILMKKKKIIYLDSMGGANYECMNTILKYLQIEHKTRLNDDLDDGWECESLSHKIPQQDNSSDCGVFSCKFAEYISLGFDNSEQFNFSAAHMQSYRKLICYHITQGGLPPFEL